MIQRHHLCLIRSEIAPKYGIKPFNTIVKWNELDALTKKEQAEINKLNAETAGFLVLSGAIDGQDERHRIMNEPKSGYSGLGNEEAKRDQLNEGEQSDLTGAENE